MRDLPQGRLRSLDVLRGLAIGGMILVNNPGDWSKTFAPLLHAEWHGWTPTDLVFPCFLFVMGVAIPFALAARLERAGPDRAGVTGKIVRRTLILLALGLVLNIFPGIGIDWETVRWPGVLQRIAAVYLVSALAYLHLDIRRRAWLTGGVLAGYWLLMKLVPVPGYGAGDLSPDGNLAAWLDQLLLGQHVWREAPGPGDPEGILSTLPALATALIGVFTGELLRSPGRRRQKIVRLWVAAAAGVALGLLVGEWFPVNKNLWTSSFVLLTAGLSLAMLAGVYYLVDVKGHDRWAAPFYILGLNSIAAFVGSGLLARVLSTIRWQGSDGVVVTLKLWLYGTLIDPLLPDYWASLAWALATVLLWVGIMSLLYRRRIFIKI